MSFYTIDLSVFVQRDTIFHENKTTKSIQPISQIQKTRTMDAHAFVLIIDLTQAMILERVVSSHLDFCRPASTLGKVA